MSSEAMRHEAMRWQFPIRVSAICILALASSPIAAQGSEIMPWNQEEVASLAKQLSKTVTELRRATINDPILADRRLPNDRAAKEFRDSMKSLETACRQLSTKLENGEDRDKTTGVAKKTGMLIRKTQRAGRRVMVSESQWAAVDPAIELINQISPYYSEKSPLLPPSQQR
jgi:hypothetical protein